jgi:hypothetical protein
MLPMEIDDLIIERLSLKESQLMQQADAIDVKASIMLGALVFLGGHSTYILSRPVPVWLLMLQVVSIGLQVAAAGYTAWILQVRDYPCEDILALISWKQQLSGYHDAPQVTENFKRALTTRASERIAAIKSMNESKADAFTKVFRFCLIAFALNVLATIYVLVTASGALHR